MLTFSNKINIKSICTKYAGISLQVKGILVYIGNDIEILGVVLTACLPIHTHTRFHGVACADILLRDLIADVTESRIWTLATPS